MEILNDIKNLYNNFFDLKILLNYFLFLMIALFVLFIFLVRLDFKKDYDINKLFMKMSKRTNSNSIGGGEEYYFRYWVWQRNKRRYIVKVLASLTFDNMYFPKEKWRKKGRVQFPFRRECWINTSSLDKNTLQNFMGNYTS